MCSSSGGSGVKRSSFLFSPEKPPVYPHKRTPAPHTPSATARTPSTATKTPSASSSSAAAAWHQSSFTPVRPAPGEGSPRTRARSIMNTSAPAIGGSSISSGFPQSPAPAASKTPSIYTSPFAAAASAKASADPEIKTPSAGAHLVSESPAAAAAAAAISLRRSPRLAAPTSNSQSLDQAARRRVPAKTLGRVDDARHTRIIKMVVSASGFAALCWLVPCRLSFYFDTVKPPPNPPPPLPPFPLLSLNSLPLGSTSTPSSALAGPIASRHIVALLTLNLHWQHARMSDGVDEAHAAAATAIASSSPPPSKSDFASKFYEFLVSKGKTSQDKSFRLE
jgi:hypothetical protein